MEHRPEYAPYTTAITLDRSLLDTEINQMTQEYETEDIIFAYHGNNNSPMHLEFLQTGAVEDPRLFIQQVRAGEPIFGEPTPMCLKRYNIFFPTGRELLRRLLMPQRRRCKYKRVMFEDLVDMYSMIDELNHEAVDISDAQSLYSRREEYRLATNLELIEHEASKIRAINLFLQIGSKIAPHTKVWQEFIAGSSFQITFPYQLRRLVSGSADIGNILWPATI